MAELDNDDDMVFAPDEMSLREVDRRWHPDYLLSIDAIFYLKDISEKLNLNVRRLTTAAKKLNANGGSSWKVMGIMKFWSHWVVRMSVFSVYYQEQQKSRVNSVCYDWDCNTMLSQKGLFWLSEVCENLPFTAHQLMYRAKKNPHAAVRWGIWQDEKTGRYMVKMEIFSEWIVDVWRNEGIRKRG